MSVVTAIDLIEPGLAVALGAAVLWFPSRYRRAAQQRHAARLAEIEAGAEETYFEEKRALESYRPARRDRTWQLLGAGMVLLGALQVFIILTG